jgi:pimeloyl-ACP methyl ester carboxylesterase
MTQHASTLAFTQAGKGQVLLLLHAFPLDSRMWLPQVEALASSFCVLTPDLAGFGASAALGPVVDVDQHARDVLTLMDRVGITTAWVGGLSMGGYVALALAALAPSRISRLLLMDTRAAPDSAQAREGRAASINTVNTQGVPTLVSGMLPKLVGPGASATVVERVRNLGGAQGSPGVLAGLQMLRDRPDRRGLLPSLSMPTRVVVGDADALTPPQEATEMAAAIPGATLHVIAGAGHLSNLEQPASFNAVIKEWA